MTFLGYHIRLRDDTNQIWSYAVQRYGQDEAITAARAQLAHDGGTGHGTLISCDEWVESPED